MAKVLIAGWANCEDYLAAFDDGFNDSEWEFVAPRVCLVNHSLGVDARTEILAKAAKDCFSAEMNAAAAAWKLMSSAECAGYPYDMEWRYLAYATKAGNYYDLNDVVAYCAIRRYEVNKFGAKEDGA